MATVRLNYDDLKIVAEGEHEATIREVEVTRSKSNIPMLKLTLDVNGTKLFDYLMLKGAGAFKLKQFIKSVGLDLEHDDEFDTDTVIGEMVSIEVVHQSNDYGENANVKKYL